MQKILSKADIVLILIVLVLFGAILILRPFAGGNTYVEIKTPYTSYIYPLSENRVLNVKGLIGESVIEIKDGKAFFVSSPCPNKNCISEGEISDAGAFSACLPNGISMTITGAKEVDDISI